MVTDLIQIRELGTAKEAENLDFRRYLRAHHRRIEEFQKLAAEIQEQIDCTQCANCCRYSVVSVVQRDIEAIARHLGEDSEHVIRHYTEPDPEAGTRRILRSTSEGCVFLDGNLCMIYEARPEVCMRFPHVASGMRTLGGRLPSLYRWASLCPIIYNAVETYKHVVGYRGAEPR